MVPASTTLQVAGTAGIAGSAIVVSASRRVVDVSVQEGVSLGCDSVCSTQVLFKTWLVRTQWLPEIGKLSDYSGESN
jgi:hypothetical protein